MNNLVIMKDKQAVTTSLRVAEVFDKRHDNVMRDIRGLLKNEGTQHMFVEGTYVNEQNLQSYPMYYMNRDGFTLLGVGFNGQKATDFKLKYIQAFNTMQSQLEQVSKSLALPTTPRGQIQLLMRGNEETNQRIDTIDQRMTDFEQNRRLETGDYTAVSHGVSKAVREYVQSHHLQLTKEQRSALYKDINGGLNQVCGVRARSQIREKGLRQGHAVHRNLEAHHRHQDDDAAGRRADSHGGVGRWKIQWFFAR